MQFPVRRVSTILEDLVKKVGEMNEVVGMGFWEKYGQDLVVPCNRYFYGLSMANRIRLPRLVYYMDDSEFNVFG